MALPVKSQDVEAQTQSRSPIALEDSSKMRGNNDSDCIYRGCGRTNKKARGSGRINTGKARGSGRISPKPISADSTQGESTTA
ncbi:hypothetical protein IQ249_05955 [Lusitaniella coriacea LEGE 07157]|uniref:Uncharacterized protein n=1 Tax=Lusitaniella coriacea LEGE 07157 TaxID=945747 RepID=A0A8J7B7P7_9CYAN|nr:hypothetical protein [Lusitaniella coriacea]MBE9115441.1 hypothetical protein [Lusitaniella coriacea LEGE 07157]